MEITDKKLVENIINFEGDILTETRRNKYFLAILSAGVVIRLAFVFAIPSWQSPDEYPHYWVAKEIAETWEYPLNSNEFPRYEAFQPPLYYLVLSIPVYLQNQSIPFAEGIYPPSLNLITLRLFSVIAGALSLIFAYLFFRNIPSLKEDEKLYAAAFIALLPTLSGVNASINNDSLTILLSFISLFYISKEKAAFKEVLLGGVFGGLAVLTKMNALPVFIIGAFLIFKRNYPDSRKNFSLLISYTLPWLIFTGILFFRDALFYGDIFVIAPEKERYFGFSLSYSVWAVRNLIYSFWLAFGRFYKVVPPPAAYALTFLPVMLLALWGWMKRKVEDKNLLIEITGSILITASASLYYTLTYKEGTMTSWGKNLYPVLPYFSLFFILGWKKFLNNNMLPNICLSILLFWNIWAIINLSLLK